MKSEKPTARPWTPVIVAMTYALTGWLGLALAISPGFGSPLFPAAGVAVVGAIVCGRAMWLPLWVAAFAVNYAFAGAPEPKAIAVVAAIATGATAQAALAAALLKRHCPVITLSEPREIALFFVLAGPVASLVSCTVGASALVLSGLALPSTWPQNWATWWTGDSLGVLIAAPIMLAFFGAPRALWRPRVRSVALPLSVVAVLSALAMEQAREWEHARARAVFERNVANAHSALSRSLEGPLHALQAMHGVYAASTEVSGDDFSIAARTWTTGSQAQWLTWTQRIPKAGAGAADDDAFVVQFVEPLVGHADEVGADIMTRPPHREAVDRARLTDAPAASASFPLGDDVADTGVVVYRALYRGDPTSAKQRLHQTMGVVGLTFRMGATLQPILAELPQNLDVCLVDIDGSGASRRLAGRAGCEALSKLPHLQVRALPFAQRQWEVRLWPRDGMLPGTARPDRWLFSVITVLATALFGALLLTMTGRTRRIQAAVDERTAELQREIRERQRTEAALRDSEQRFRNILNHVPIGVIYTDLQGRIQESNPTFRELVGFDVDTLHGMRSLDFTHPDDRLEDIDLARRLVAGDINVYQRQKRFVRADGQPLWARVIVSLLRDERGRPHRIVGVVEDITEHLRLQEAEDARELAEAANRAKSDFLSRMSHELRTPLNAMLGFAQLIELDRQQALSHSQREWVGQIQTAGWHLLEMINDTLDLSRIESGTLKLDITPMDLPQALAATIPLIERAAQARGITLSQSLDAGAARINGDPTRVKQILTNLLSNAVKYNVDGGRIDISTRRTRDDVVQVTVADSGLGMSRAQLGALFQPFNRLGRERSAQEGTGIGLVISQRLAELMGGRLVATSVEGVGSTFTLTLPGAVARDLAGDRDDGADALDHDYRQRVVHYIEDNHTNAIVMEGILAQRPQVCLRVSSSGAEGLEAIRESVPSLVLLDMHLPDIDGIDLLRQLKDDAATAHVPVIVVSADAVASRIGAALEAGAEFYLTKPVNVAELLSLVDRVLEERDTLFG